MPWYLESQEANPLVVSSWQLYLVLLMSHIGWIISPLNLLQGISNHKGWITSKCGMAFYTFKNKLVGHYLWKYQVFSNFYKCVNIKKYVHLLVMFSNATPTFEIFVIDKYFPLKLKVNILFFFHKNSNTLKKESWLHFI